MRELALHILDLIENAVTAGASRVAVEIALERQWDLMRIVVEDNGPGLTVPVEKAMDPFYTTKKGKKTGLGLSLFRFRIEQAGGELALQRSALGGLAVRASLRLTHVDRNPIGNLASTFASVLAANPELELSLCIKVDGRERVITSIDVVRERVAPSGYAPSGYAPDGSAMAADTEGSVEVSRPKTVARQMYLRIKAGLEALQIKE
ncbi:MAG: ATP-binding protein [Spirochaetaceae bacterium]|nr:MAG: ATP-binding protein [Spirochaetaceae bacterium]